MTGDEAESDRASRPVLLEPLTTIQEVYSDTKSLHIMAGSRCGHLLILRPSNEVAKKWIEGVSILGAKSMRVNSGGPRIAPTPIPDPASGYPKNDMLTKYLTACTESFKEMADHGGKHGVRVTL